MATYILLCYELIKNTGRHRSGVSVTDRGGVTHIMRQYIESYICSHNGLQLQSFPLCSSTWHSNICKQGCMVECYCYCKHLHDHNVFSSWTQHVCRNPANVRKPRRELLAYLIIKWPLYDGMPTNTHLRRSSQSKATDNITHCRK